MTKFIANNWIAIIIVLAVIVVGLVVALIIMDRKDKKLIADYKASVKASKSKSATASKVVEEDEVDEEEDEIDEIEDKKVEKVEKESKPIEEKQSTTKKSK